MEDWIQASDALPEDLQQVLIAIKWQDGTHSVSAGIRRDAVWYGCWFDFEDPIQIIRYGEVLAWMPQASYG